MRALEQSDLAGLKEAGLRHKKLLEVLRIQNSDKPKDDVLMELSSILSEVIPHDRFSVGMFLANTWAVAQNGRATWENFTRPITEVDSASFWVFRNGEPIIRPHIEEDMRFTYDKTNIAEGMLSDLVLPLIESGHVVGTFNFTSQEPGRYTQLHLDRALSVADVIATVFRQQESRQQLEAIRQITLEIVKSGDAEPILNMIMDHIRAAGYDRVRLYLYDAETDEMVLTAANSADVRATRIAFPVATDPCSLQTLASNSSQIYRSDHPELEAIALGKDRNSILMGLSNDARSEWCEVPMTAEGANETIVVGKLSVDNADTKRPLVQERVDRLMIYASQAALVLHNARLRREGIERTDHLREALARVDRMTTLDQLGGSIAHELNQPLTGILSNAQAVEILVRRSSYDTIAEIIVDVIEDTKRAGAILRNLRELHQQQDLDLKSVSINGLVTDTLSLLGSEFVRKRIEASSRLAPDNPRVLGNRIQLQQVLMNLLSNAQEAITDQPKMRLISIVVETVDDSGSVEVSITDSGPGITESKLEKIFDPMDSTSPGGLGMGLAICRSIVDAHGGKIWAGNIPGSGARLTFSVPTERRT